VQGKDIPRFLSLLLVTAVVRPVITSTCLGPRTELPQGQRRRRTTRLQIVCIPTALRNTFLKHVILLYTLCDCHHALFYATVTTLYSMRLSPRSILCDCHHALFYATVTTLYSMRLSPRSILRDCHHALFYATVTTLYSMRLSPLSILRDCHHAPFHATVTTLPYKAFHALRSLSDISCVPS
jgi:hypothetical protein